ncbi:MAG: permease [Firmicutes bacterium]|nr:permease [Bacillota bacterium]MDY5530886.1 permease [Pumilibacteraceae bacterium]
MEAKAIGIMGLAICMILSGAGSAIGLYKTGSAAAGVLAEDGKKFSKVIVLALLPATQGIYGFVLAVMKLGSVDAGWGLFMAMLAMGFNGLISAYLQGKTAAACIYAVGKNAAGSGKYVLFPAMIEFYAILSLVLGIMITI